MIVQEKILKEGDHLARRINELGLGLNDYKILDWNPMWGILFYEAKEETKTLPQNERLTKTNPR